MTPNVRFGSLADILRCGSDVRFTPLADEGGRGRMPLCVIIELSTCARMKSY